MHIASFFSSEGMGSQPTKHLLTMPHLLYILLAAVALIVLISVLKDQKKRTQDIVIILSCILLLVLKYAGEAVFVYEYYAYGEPVSPYTHAFWDVRTFFSFQMCGVNNVLLPIVVIFNIRWMKDFIYTTSIIGGLAVILYPVGVFYGDPLILSFPMVRSLVVHFLLLFLPIYLIAVGRFRLKAKHWRRTLIGTLSMGVWAMIGNLFLEPTTNNMYLMSNPFYDGPIPVLNHLPDGYHVLALAVLIFIGFVLVYKMIFIYQRHLDDQPFYAYKKVY